MFQQNLFSVNEGVFTLELGLITSVEKRQCKKCLELKC